MVRLLAPLLASTLLGCATRGELAQEQRPATIEASLDAITTWSAAQQGKEPFPPPFLSRFVHDGRTLDFVATRHSGGPEDSVQTFRLIKKVLQTAPVEVVVIEGVGRDLGVNPQPILDGLANAHPGGNFDSEALYSAWLAHERSIPFLGAEPSNAQIDLVLRAAGRAPEELLTYALVQQVMYRRRAQELVGADALAELFVTCMRDSRPAVGVPYDFPFTLDDARAWYAKLTGEPFDPMKISGNTLAPIAEGTRLQALSAQRSKVRNDTIIGTLVQQLHEHRHVLVVYGAGHLTMQRPVLELMLGKPVLETQSP